MSKIEDANDILKMLPPFLAESFKAYSMPKEDKQQLDISRSNHGALIGLNEDLVEEDVYEVLEVLEPFKLQGDTTLLNAKVQVFDQRFKVKASIDTPGGGKYWMNFKNLLIAEDDLVKARSTVKDESYKRFARMISDQYIRPLYPLCVTGSSSTRQYKFAASCLFDETDTPVHPGTFVIMIWNGDVAQEMWFMNGSEPLRTVPLIVNQHFYKNPKSPKWEAVIK